MLKRLIEVRVMWDDKARGLRRLVRALWASVLKQNSFSRERGRWYAVRLMFRFWRWGWMNTDRDDSR